MLIFAHHKESMSMLSAYLELKAHAYYKIDGDTPQSERQNLIERKHLITYFKERVKMSDLMRFKFHYHCCISHASL